MNEIPASSPTANRPLRLWPGVLIVLVMWACLKVPGYFIPGDTRQLYFVFFGPMILTVLFLIWWVFFSRARWADRGLRTDGQAAIGTAAYFTYDRSFNFFGVIMYMIPLMFSAWVGWLPALIPGSARGSKSRIRSRDAARLDLSGPPENGRRRR